MYILDPIEQKYKTSAVEKLIENSTPNRSFYTMVILAVAMASLGLLLDNIAIVIGSMLISPLLFSLLGVAMGLSMSNNKLIIRSLRTFLKSVLFGIIVSLITTLLFSSIDVFSNEEILSRTFSGLPFAVVALIAGFAAAFSIVNPKLNESFSGIAISVALLPPIATIGIGLGLLHFSIVRGALVLLLTNIIGILASSLIAFSMMNFHTKNKLADDTIKLEEKELKKNTEH
jgi:uncharacterized hydrophobic protein (TIGR00341 family)